MSPILGTDSERPSVANIPDVDLTLSLRVVLVQKNRETSCVIEGQQLLYKGNRIGRNVRGSCHIVAIAYEETRTNNTDSSPEAIGKLRRQSWWRTLHVNYDSDLDHAAPDSINHVR